MAGDKCHFCQSVFPSSLSLERHVQETHLQPGEPKCAQCNYRSPDSHLLNTHMRQCHEDSEGEGNQKSPNVHFGPDIVKGEKVDEDPLMEMLEVQKHMSTCMSNVSNVIAALRNELASVKRQRNKLFEENGFLKERVGRLEKCLQERNDTSTETTPAKEDTPQKSGCKDQNMPELEKNCKEEAPPKVQGRNELAQGLDSNKGQDNHDLEGGNQTAKAPTLGGPVDQVPSNDSRINRLRVSVSENKDYATGAEKGPVPDDSAKISEQTEVHGQGHVSPAPVDLYTSSEDESGGMEVEDNDPEGTRKKSANDDFNINQSDSDSNDAADNQDGIERDLYAEAIGKRRPLSSELDRELRIPTLDSADEEEIAKERGPHAVDETVEVKTEDQEDSLAADKGSGISKLGAISDVNLLGDQGNTTDIKREPTEPQDQDGASDEQSEVQLGVNSIARTFASDMERAFINDFIKTDARKKDGKHYCQRCRKSIHPTRIRVHVKEYHLRPGSMYKCPKCEITRRNRNNFTTHIKKHPGLKREDLEQWIVYPCPSCKRNFKDQEDRKSHVSRDHPHLKIGRSNSESNSIVSETSDATKGEKVMNATKISRNKDFSMSFKKIVEKKAGGFLCKPCNKPYTSYAGAYNHAKNRHMYEYKCQRCGQIINSEAYLRRHYHEKHPNHKVNIDQCRVLKQA